MADIMPLRAQFGTVMRQQVGHNRTAVECSVAQNVRIQFAHALTQQAHPSALCIALLASPFSPPPPDRRFLEERELQQSVKAFVRLGTKPSSRVLSVQAIVLRNPVWNNSQRRNRSHYEQYEPVVFNYVRNAKSAPVQ